MKTETKRYWSCIGLIEAVHPSWAVRTVGWSVWRSQDPSSGRSTSDRLCVQGHDVWFALCDCQASSHCHCILCEPLTTRPLGRFCVKTQVSRELTNSGGFCVSFSDFRQQGGFCVSLPVISRTLILCELKGLRLGQVALETRSATSITKAAFSELFIQQGVFYLHSSLSGGVSLFSISSLRAAHSALVGKGRGISTEYHYY